MAATSEPSRKARRPGSTVACSSLATYNGEAPRQSPRVARMSRTPRFRYSRWDGSQVGFDLDAEAILEEITDDLLYHGDLHAALRHLMQQGFRDRNDEQVMGMRDLMERLRRKRRDQLEQYDLGGVYEEIAEQLREVLDM